jgi:hypothetical protein
MERPSASPSTQKPNNTLLSGDSKSKATNGNKEQQYPASLLSTPQIKRLYAKSNSNHWSNAYANAYIKGVFNKAGRDLSYGQYESACKFFDENPFNDIFKDQYKDYLEPGGEKVKQFEVAKKDLYEKQNKDLKNYAPSFDANEEIPF